MEREEKKGRLKTGAKGWEDGDGENRGTYEEVSLWEWAGEEARVLDGLLESWGKSSWHFKVGLLVIVSLYFSLVQSCRSRRVHTGCYRRLKFVKESIGVRGDDVDKRAWSRGQEHRAC